MGVAAVFLVGCAVCGRASGFVVPKASAQRAVTLTRWEVMCATRDAGSFEEVAALVTKLGNAAGSQG